MLIVMDKSTHEEQLFQPLHTNNKQFEIAVTFLTGCNGIFNVTNSNNKFYFLKSTTDEDGDIRITILPGAYEVESLKSEIKRIINDEGHYTEAIYPFTIKPTLSTLRSVITISIQGPIITFVPDDSIRDLLVFDKITFYEEFNLSQNPVDLLSPDNFFLNVISLKVWFSQVKDLE